MTVGSKSSKYQTCFQKFSGILHSQYILTIFWMIKKNNFLFPFLADTFLSKRSTRNKPLKNTVCISYLQDFTVDNGANGPSTKPRSETLKQA